METEDIRDEVEIDIAGLLLGIWHRMVVIVLVAILAGGLTFIYNEFFVDPEYVSTTKVYILSTNDDDQYSLTSQDMSFATYLANDYQVLLKSEPVIQSVIDNLNLERSVSSVANMVSVELEENTRIIDISVRSTDPKLAKKIADEIRDVANENIKDIMDGIEAVHPIDEANLPTSSVSPKVARNTMVGFIIGFALAAIVVAILYIMDDTMKTPEDVEKRLGMTVLASIPLKSEDNVRKDKRRKKSKESKERKPEEEEGETTNA